MFSLLLIIIYISFISLGLPDALLGSAWPSMYRELNVPVSYAGIISMIIAGGTIVSSLMSDRLIKKLGTGIVTSISVGLTAAALLGFSLSNSFLTLCICSVPYGLGAGSVDAALNNFVALHYKSRHMSWLHCFWGIGATLGPYIMGQCLTNGFRWNTGYNIIFVIQIILTVCLIFSLPLWKKASPAYTEESDADKNSISIQTVLKTKIGLPILISFMCYCAIESTAGLWASSYMVMFKNISADLAASWASLFYIGITAGRLISGFVTFKLNDKNIVRAGQLLIVLGLILLMLPLNNAFTLVGLLTVGLGCAPIYPGLLHATPEHFGKESSQSAMGLQMASAYIGSTFIPPIFGIIASHISIGLYPVFMFVFIVCMTALLEYKNKIFRN